MNVLSTEFNSLTEVLEKAEAEAKNLPKPKLAVVKPDDPQIIHGVNLAYEHGLIEPVLIGDKKTILSTLSKLSLKEKDFNIIHTPSEKEAIILASDYVVNGKTDVLIPGRFDVPKFFKILFSDECNFRRRGDFLSSVGVMEHKHYSGLLLLSDIGLIPNPTVDQGIRIINNVVEVAHILGKKTVRVGILAFEDAPIPQSPTSIAESVIMEFFTEEKDPSVIVEGPMRLDMALKPDAIPCIPTEGIEQGVADVLIANNIHAGNSMYKAMITLCNASSASVVIGGRCPIALPSGSESPENILNSIALSVLIHYS
ncbi:MAG: phosphate acyltransferase [Candidatus Electryonea clarkiae]|nr:phosphate acyltransferase [Candidatus Electryonea clarkiae]MDP8287594.1 phosphate acyltransferase [Candidatus Electryonea clarkiae]